MADPPSVAPGPVGAADPLRLFQQLVLHSPIAYVVYAPDGTCLFSNRAHRELLGPELPPPLRFDAPVEAQDSGVALVDHVRQAFAGDTIFLPVYWLQTETSVEDADERLGRLAAEVTIFPLRGEDQSVIAVALCFEDVTADLELKVTGERLRDSENRLRNAQRIARLGSWQLELGPGAAPGALQLSEESLDIFGYLPGSVQVTAEGALQCIHPEDRSALVAAGQELLSGASSAGAMLRVIRPDGEVRVVLGRAEVERDPRTLLPTRLIGTVHDVTESQAAEQALRQSEEHLRQTLQAARMVSWRIDYEHDRLTISDNAPGVLGFAPPVNLRALSSCFHIIHPSDRALVRAAFAGGARGGIPRSLEFRIVRPDTGGLVWIEGRSEIVRNPAQQVIGARGLLADISDRKRAEQAIIESRAQWRALVEHAPDMVMNIARDGTVRFVNRMLPPLLRTQAIGTPWLQLVPPSERPRLQALFEQVLATGKATTYELEMEGLDGQSVTYSNHLGPIILDGEVAGAVLIARDITQSKATEAQMMVADRMTSAGTLAAGLGHEINTPLVAVTINLELAQQQTELLGPSAAPLAVMLADAREAAERVRAIVRDLQVFSRAADDDRGSAELRTVLESTLRSALPEIRYRTNVTCEHGEVPRVRGNPSRLGQVFLNLLINAAQAMGEGDARRNDLRIRTRMDASGRVAVDFTDTGPGMSAEVQRRLFTPFFTTKPAGVGTGLGLAVCQSIVAGCGGEIRVASELGKGSTFTVLLQPAVAHPAAPEPITSLPSAAETSAVMVIDDEALVLSAIRRMLTPEHRVDTFTDAREALRRLGTGARYDTILCDLMMPNMSGMELYEALRAKQPDHAERLVFMTGGVFSAAARAFLDRVSNERIEKPFEVNVLRRVVAADKNRAGK
jgi:PAS domain S-box-containing protein